ncbi:Glycosyltransferase family 1 protein [Rhizoctonia solani]|uniref:Glycosyltransferase family 1 protein n=1 Tax=Rhizoctonia solani TaxID=456999 RepID=A0A8H7LWW4_9AGAM|nr:Glycosyltransferase family 1 protein [Rhizoctonia solani]
MIIPDDYDSKKALSEREDQSEYNRDSHMSSESDGKPRRSISVSDFPQPPNHGELGPPRYEEATQGAYPAVQEDEPSAEFRTAAMAASAAFQPDGRFQVSIDVPSGRLPKDYAHPLMNLESICRGISRDVQPYLALGKQLRRHGHTVRLTTHETFRQSVKDAGLRFFNIGGNPHELMNITRKQMMVAEMLERCWRSCYEPDDATEGSLSFAADAIISNPPTFAHIHCAEALGIPLLIDAMVSNYGLPHPLVNVRSSQAEPRITNYLTYGLADAMTWQGFTVPLGIIRLWNYRTLRCTMDILYVPALVPKPQDWVNHIGLYHLFSGGFWVNRGHATDVVGFYFLDLATEYTPPDDLIKFLDAGEPPIYIGFGSIVVENPVEVTKIVLSAITESGVRTVISAGWGSLDNATLQDARNPNIFILGNVPHDWLFERVSAVVHHGGAGTVAIGLRCGKPTIVVPFFGDQPWWGDQYMRGAGPAPIPHKKLTTPALVGAIKSALSDETKAAAQRVGEMIRAENGVKNGVDSFHKHLPLLDMRCDLDPKRVAVWYSRSHKLRLSAFAAQVLAEKGILDVNKLELHRPREYITRVQPSDPISGTLGPTLGVVGDVLGGVGGLFTPRPEKGVIKLVRAAPEGVRGILEGLHHGMNNAPKIYGGSVRDPGKVTGFRSGIREGRKCRYGFYDGLTDIVREPVDGFKKHGVIGGAGGLIIGLTNAVVKPTAGVIGLLSQPVEGTIQSVRSSMAKPAKERHATRYAQGVGAFKSSSEAEREAVFMHSKKRGVDQRESRGLLDRLV